MNKPIDPAKWDKTHKLLQDMKVLNAQRDEYYRKLGWTVAWARALAHVGHVPDEASAVIRASDLGSYTEEMPPALQSIWRQYAQRHFMAVVGAHLKAGGSVLFREPIPPMDGRDVPTYEAFKASLKPLYEPTKGNTPQDDGASSQSRMPG